MKEIIIAFCAILAVSTAMVVLNIESRDTPHLLGAKACTWGPSYWCQNLTTAAGCNAVKHCIPKVWEKMQVPKDTDSVCEICENMVKQARDQLESKQTQEDLKAVFEGSCALIHIKPIIKECDKLVDQFIPELVETLASQMNPSVVCSVAGLCNSAHIDKLLEENKNLLTADSKNIKSNIDECSQCFSIANHMENKFAVASRDSVLERFLNICGELSSLSDACSSIVLTHFEAIYNHLQSNLNAKNICHISGQCSEKFHTHENTPMVEVRPLSSTGMVEVGDDLPCELCEKLVSHLRDLLVANTTESEFEQVLLGLCKQTKSFSQECKAIVEQYYPEIYSFLTKRLNGNAICQMASICPLPGKTESKPIWPLVSNENKKLGVQIMSTEIKPSNTQINNIQLTLNKFDTPIKLFDDKYCSSCTFVTNYLKHSIRNRTDRVEVESVIKEMKTVLPGASEQSDEINFLMKYDVALVELILQNKGFSEICELVAVCPTSQLIQTWDKISETSNKKVSEKNKPNCPLCLFAVTQVYEDVKNAMSEDNIKAALNKLCHKLPKQLDGECKEFVEIYSQKIIDYLLKNETPEAVCVQLKLCDPKNEGHKLFQKVVAVPKMDLHGKETCALCEYILHYIQTAVTDPKADDEVKKALDKVCNVLPKQIVNDCNQFIEIYGDAVVSIIAQEIDPSQVCPMIHLCPANQAKYEVVPAKVADKPNCPLCLFGVTQLYNVVKDKKTEESIEKALDTLCVHLPTHLVSPCEDFVKEHSEKIIESMMADLSPQEVCVYLRLCNAPKHSEPEITLFPLDQDGEIMMNEIPNFPLYTVDNKNTPEVTFESDNDKNLKDNSYECKICELVLQYLDKVVDNKKSKKDIEKAFHGACAKLPKRWSAKCDSFVDEYAEIVIELLTQEVSPEQVCTIMELCQSDSKKFEGTIAEFDNSVSECALCQAIVTYFEKLLDDKKSEEYVHDVLIRVCDHLPTSYKENCEKFIEAYGDKIIRTIEHEDVRKVCSKLSSCPQNDFIVTLFKTGRSKRFIH